MASSLYLVNSLPYKAKRHLPIAIYGHAFIVSYCSFHFRPKLSVMLLHRLRSPCQHCTIAFNFIPTYNVLVSSLEDVIFTDISPLLCNSKQTILNVAQFCYANTEKFCNILSGKQQRIHPYAQFLRKQSVFF